jgi:hypothetical protein
MDRAAAGVVAAEVVVAEFGLVDRDVGALIAVEVARGEGEPPAWARPSASEGSCSSS